MSEQSCAHAVNFDQFSTIETASAIGHDALTLANIAIRFSLVDRVPRYTPDTRENDAEHSYMLGLVSQELAARYFPFLDTGMVAQLSLVHDLLELKTGDIATFVVTEGQLADKASAEHAALEELCAELTPYTAMLLRTYEKQELPEARFVRFIDKLLPVLVDILGPGSQVMHEDYGTYTHDQLDEAENVLKARFERMFPEPHFHTVHAARNLLAMQFAAVFKPANQYQEQLF